MIKIVSKYEETLAENLRLKQENSTLRDRIENLKKDKRNSNFVKLLFVILPVALTVASGLFGYGFIFFFEVLCAQAVVPFYRYVELGIILLAVFGVVYGIMTLIRTILRKE